MYSPGRSGCTAPLDAAVRVGVDRPGSADGLGLARAAGHLTSNCGVRVVSRRRARRPTRTVCSPPTGSRLTIGRANAAASSSSWWASQRTICRQNRECSSDAVVGLGLAELLPQVRVVRGQHQHPAAAADADLVADQRRGELLGGPRPAGRGGVPPVGGDGEHGRGRHRSADLAQPDEAGAVGPVVEPPQSRRLLLVVPEPVR